MCFVTAGMGGGTGTGAAPVVARAAREKGILTVGVVTKPFHFEGQRRMRTADMGIADLQKNVDTLIVIPNQNLFRIANDKTTFADAFAMADQVLYSGVACITDLMVKEGLINLDFADVRSVMREMGKAMMGTGEASGDGRAMAAAEAAIANPLLDETSMRGAKGLLISITGGRDMTLFEVDEAATRIREEVDQDANIILGATFDESLEGIIRVSVVATGIDKQIGELAPAPIEFRQPLKPIAKPAQQAAARVETVARPVVQQPAARVADPVADAIRAAEQDMPQRAPQPAEQEFRPQSRIFQAPAPEVFDAPFAAAPQAAGSAGTSAADAGCTCTAAGCTRACRMSLISRRSFRRNSMPATWAARDNGRDQASYESQEDRGPMGLLKRLTAGLTRREDETARLEPAQPREPAMRPAEPRRPLSQDASIYAPRRGQLDEQGRVQPQTRQPSEDDQLEIPAFLRRQAN